MSAELCRACKRDPRTLPIRVVVQITVGAYGEDVPVEHLPPDAPAIVREPLRSTPARWVFCYDCTKAGAVQLHLDAEIVLPEAVPDIPADVLAVPGVAEALASRPRAARAVPVRDVLAERLADDERRAGPNRER